MWWFLRTVCKLIFGTLLFGAVAALLYWQRDRVKQAWGIARDLGEKAAPLKDLLP